MKRMLILLTFWLGIAYGQNSTVQMLQNGIYVPRGAWIAADSSKLIMPDTTLTTAVSGGTAYKVILGSLLDPVYCTNYDLLRQAEKSSGLGTYNPDYFAVTITTGQDSLIIWDTQQMTRYLIWVKAASNMLGASAFNDVAWKNGILTVGTSSGVYRVNLLTGVANLYATTGISTYAGTLAQRNSARGYLVNNASPALLSNAVVDIEVFDDPQGKLEPTGFPSQWWAAAHTSTGIHSVYNPYTNTIYTRTSSAQSNAVTGVPGGTVSFTLVDNPQNLNIARSIFAFNANGLGQDISIGSNKFGASDVAWLGANTNLLSKTTMIPELSIAGGRSPVQVAGGDSGAYIFHLAMYGTSAKQDTAGVKILINTGSNGPPEFGNTVLAVQFDSLSGWGTDKSPYANNLTASGTHNSVNGVVGKADSLTASGYWSRTADTDFQFGTSPFAVAAWAKSHSATNPAGSQEMVSLRSADASDAVRLEFLSDGTARFQVSDDGFVTADIVNPSVDFYDAKWHFFVGVFGNNTFYLYVDGELSGSTAASNVNTSLDPVEVYPGAIAGGTLLFAGTLDEVIVVRGTTSANTASVITAAQIRWLYARGNSAQQLTANVNDALTALPTNYVTSTRSGYIAVGGTDSLSILNQYGIPIRQIASPGGNIQSVALQELADSLSIAIGTTTRFQVIQPDPRISQLRAPKPPLLRPEQTADPCVVDSAGVHGLFRAVDDGVDGCANAGQYHVLIKDGTYGQFDADQANMVIRGSSWKTVINGGTADDAIDLNVNNCVIDNLAVATTAGAGFAFDGIAVASGSDGSIISRVFFKSSDDDGVSVASSQINFRTNWNASGIDGNVYDVTATGVSIRDHNGGNVPGAADVTCSSTGDNLSIVGCTFNNSTTSVNLAAGCDNSLVVGNIGDGAFTDGSTGSTVASNEQF